MVTMATKLFTIGLGSGSKLISSSQNFLLSFSYMGIRRIPSEDDSFVGYGTVKIDVSKTRTAFMIVAVSTSQTSINYETIGRRILEAIVLKLATVRTRHLTQCCFHLLTVQSCYK
jgi:hypothetical protein